MIGDRTRPRTPRRRPQKVRSPIHRLDLLHSSRGLGQRPSREKQRPSSNGSRRWDRPQTSFTIVRLVEVREISATSDRRGRQTDFVVYVTAEGRSDSQARDSNKVPSFSQRLQAALGIQTDARHPDCRLRRMLDRRRSSRTDRDAASNWPTPRARSRLERVRSRRRSTAIAKQQSSSRPCRGHRRSRTSATWCCGKLRPAQADPRLRHGRPPPNVAQRTAKGRRAQAYAQRNQQRCSWSARPNRTRITGKRRERCFTDASKSAPRIRRHLATAERTQRPICSGTKRRRHGRRTSCPGSSTRHGTRTKRWKPRCRELEPSRPSEWRLQASTASDQYGRVDRLHLDRPLGRLPDLPRQDRGKKWVPPWIRTYPAANSTTSATEQPSPTQQKLLHP